MSSACQAGPANAFQRTNGFSLPIYVLSHQLDFAACQELLAALQVDIDSGCKAIAVDLKRIGKLESSAAWLLVTVQQFLRKRNRRLLMLDPQPQVGVALARAWTAVNGVQCKN